MLLKERLLTNGKHIHVKLQAASFIQPLIKILAALNELVMYESRHLRDAHLRLPDGTKTVPTGVKPQPTGEARPPFSCTTLFPVFVRPVAIVW